MQGSARDERPQKADPARIRTLPERVRPEDMVIEIPADPPPDPEGGRNTDMDFTLRYN